MRMHSEIIVSAIDASSGVSNVMSSDCVSGDRGENGAHSVSLGDGVSRTTTRHALGDVGRRNTDTMSCVSAASARGQASLCSSHVHTIFTIDAVVVVAAVVVDPMVENERWPRQASLDAGTGGNPAAMATGRNTSTSI